MDTILRNEKIDLEHICHLWISNDVNNGRPLSRTTFYRLRQSIDDMFGIRIECNKQNQYYISNPEALRDNSTQNWMLRTLTVNNILLDGLSIKDQLLLEDVPIGLEHLETIIKAIKNHHTLTMGYQKFIDPEPYTTRIEPYCLKLFHQRWYLLGKSERKDGRLGIYALDRMTHLSESNQDFSMDPTFDAETYFNSYFGVITDDETPVETIVLRAYPPMDNYLRTLPLHHSQKELSATKEYSDFEYRLAPTLDFCQAILREGDELEVMAPASLRKHIKEKLKSAANRYSK